MENIEKSQEKNLNLKIEEIEKLQLGDDEAQEEGDFRGSSSILKESSCGKFLAIGQIHCPFLRLYEIKREHGGNKKLKFLKKVDLNCSKKKKFFN